jgi:hypothetical protein
MLQAAGAFSVLPDAAGAVGVWGMPCRRALPAPSRPAPGPGHARAFHPQARVAGNPNQLVTSGLRRIGLLPQPDRLDRPRAQRPARRQRQGQQREQR